MEGYFKNKSFTSTNDCDDMTMLYFDSFSGTCRYRIIHYPFQTIIINYKSYSVNASQAFPEVFLFRGRPASCLSVSLIPGFQFRFLISSFRIARKHEISFKRQMWYSILLRHTRCSGMTRNHEMQIHFIGHRLRIFLETVEIVIRFLFAAFILSHFLRRIKCFLRIKKPPDPLRIEGGSGRCYSRGCALRYSVIPGTNLDFLPKPPSLKI